MGIKTVVTLLFVISAASAFKVGGMSDTEMEANSETQRCVDTHSDKIKEHAMALLATGDSKPAATLFDNETPTAISYKTQMVSGTNYFIKMRIGKYYFHTRIYKDIMGQQSVTKVIGPKAENDPIVYFE